MKYIKQYETKNLKDYFHPIDNEPHIGQYAVGLSKTALEPEKSLLPTLIGKITEIDSRGFYVITYPTNIYSNINQWYFHKYQLLYFSFDKEEVEFKMMANKYNL